MPGRLSAFFSWTDGASDDSSSPSPPLPSSRHQGFSIEDVLPPPDITAGFSKLSLDTADDEFPTVNQCIAHLKLLECFYRLKQCIGSTDGLFGINDSVITGSSLVPEDKAAELLVKLSEKRWAIYLTRALDRFEAWSADVNSHARKITCAILTNDGKRGTLCERDQVSCPTVFDEQSLPPIDVLIVWHAYMLNPRAYLEDCLRLGRMQMWHSCIPWMAVADCIDSESFAYEPHQAAKDLWANTIGLPWRNLDHLPTKEVRCISCRRFVEVDYTTCMQHSPKQPSSTSYEQFSGEIDHLLSSGRGYCDRDFRRECPSCGAILTHETLKIANFYDDVQALLQSDVPVKGTVLSAYGVPFRHRNVNDAQPQHIASTLNDFLRSSSGQNMLVSHSSGSSLENICNSFEKHLPEKGGQRSFISKGFHRVKRAEKAGVRRMMYRYRETNSPFALDLVAAVIRQGSFVEKMHNIDWLHSPALPNTMKRNITKYTRFVSLMSDPSNIAVPTLDLDLVWHTHQLSPFSYLNYTTAHTRQFIDHDDKVSEVKLDSAFAWTSKKYYRLYKEPYSDCSCWYCEAVRESNVSAATVLFKSAPAVSPAAAAAATLAPISSSSSASKANPISSHDALHQNNSTSSSVEDSRLKASELEKTYLAACTLAGKEGHIPPSKDDFYYSDAYRCPVYIPAFSSY